jgi:hypothetical protein
MASSGFGMPSASSAAFALANSFAVMVTVTGRAAEITGSPLRGQPSCDACLYDRAASNSRQHAGSGVLGEQILCRRGR